MAGMLMIQWLTGASPFFAHPHPVWWIFQWQTCGTSSSARAVLVVPGMLAARRQVLHK